MNNQPKQPKQNFARLAKKANENSEKKINAKHKDLADLSRATSDYVMALANPFEGPLATIPDFPNLPSRRFRVWSKGFFSTGTNQFGYVAADPYASIVSDVDCVFSSSSSFTGSAIVVAGVGVQTSRSNSDYTASSFGTAQPSAQGRIVASGLRIRYSSTELNRGGVVAGLQVPNHSSAYNLTFAGVNAFECSNRFRPEQRWINVLYCPMYQEELNFTQNCGSPGGAFTAYTPWPFLAFVIQSPDPATSVTFEYEFYSVYEAQGRNIRSLLPSVSDPTGFAATMTTVQSSLMRPHTRDSNQHGQQVLKAVHDVAHHTISGFGGKLLSSGIGWLEREGASLLSGLFI